MPFSEALALVILEWWLIATVASQRIDQIEVAEQRGPEVVEATVQYIRQSMIFPDDQNFLRRIAFVESKDGDDPNTYRAGYHGGIWQVDRIGFQDTQNVAAHPELTSKFDAIRKAFKIDWPSVTWNDLRKPLYSAIAARLFLSNIPEAIPPSSNVNHQARYWKQYYNTPAGAGTEQKFIDDVAALPQSCSVAGVDIAFVMDGSGSIGSRDFQRSKEFVKRVAGTNIIGLTATRVGVIQYSSSPITEFDFISHTTSSSLQQAIDGISYRSGNTYTGRAITSMISLFDNGGARPTSENIPRIGIVITDGRSSDDVLAPANDARSKGITMFAIGVGAAVESELNEIANDPDSSFRYQVENFSIIGNIQGLISSETCRVPAKVDINTGFQEMLQPDTVRFISYTIPASRMVTIKISSRIGQIIGYFSYRIRNPSAALYDWKLETTATRRFVQLFIDFSNLSSVIGRRRKRQLIGADNAMTLFGTIENKSTVSADTNIITEDGDTRLPTTPVPNLSPCDPSTPCANGGGCLPNQAILGTYYCQCSGCFAGDRCDIDMACINNACQNEGQCLSFADSCDRYYCSCPPCFYGQFCENRIDVCSNHKCQNGAMCVNPQGTCRDYQCACSGCYTGAFCEIAVPNPCNAVISLCQNSGTCEPIPGYCFAYHCQCNNGYSGRNCEVAPVTNMNICNDFPCSNGGTCVSQHDGSYDCVCRPGWTGQGCRLSTSLPGSSSVCMPFLCDNGGTCYDSNTFGDLSPNQYSCICALGWAGIGCSISTDIAAPPRRCNTNPYICQNGGVCNYAYMSLSQMSIPFCVCPVGYIGQWCETQYFNPCDSNPCRNNAVCSAFNTYFVCQCFSGFSGITCNENDDNPCSSSPCQNGNCYQSLSGEYFCDCSTGFSGENCGTREADDPCSSSPCQNGNCYQALSGGEYFCDCSTGFSGTNCERDISPPIISGCPNNINRMIQIQPGQSTATVDVSWNEPTASDSSGIKSVDAIYPGTTMLTLSSGASTKVEYVFTDNFDNKAKCSFAVSVSASNGPVVTGCNLQNMQVILPSGQTSLSVSWNEPISSGIRPSFQSYRPGDSFQMGTYAVRYRFGTVPSVTVCSFILDVVDVQTVGRSKRDSFLQNDHDEIPDHLSGTRFIYPLIVFSLACVFVVVGIFVIVPKLRNLKKN